MKQTQTTTTTRHLFILPIGDWSDDGHGKTVTYICSAAKSIDEVREAYFAACEKLDEELCPESFLAAYEESEINKEILKKIEQASGMDLSDCWTESLVAYVIWFINQGDPDIKVRLEELPMLPFYGNDHKDGHIGYIGYGLFT